jgi:hypothetical protein
MTEISDFRYQRHDNDIPPKRRRRRIGRPTVRRNGIPLSGYERIKRYRQRRKRNRKQNNFEWYLPADVVAACRQALGGSIDLDPATALPAQKIIQAKTFYTIETNGLLHPWHAKSLLLNPPYANGLVQPFVD